MSILQLTKMEVANFPRKKSPRKIALRQKATLVK